jgi:hypothetical protein
VIARVPPGARRERLVGRAAVLFEHVGESAFKHQRAAVSSRLALMKVSLGPGTTGTSTVGVAPVIRMAVDAWEAAVGSKGDCFDNAVAESFFATIKKELVHRRSWPSKAELRTEIFDYIEIFYNRQRRHSTLGQLSPAQYEMMMMSQDLQEHQAA